MTKPPNGNPHDGNVPKVVARVTVIGGKLVSVKIAFRNVKGVPGSVVVPQGTLLDRHKLMKTLMDADCRVPLDTDAQKDLQVELYDTTPTDEIWQSLSTGWIGGRFIFPDDVVGKATNGAPEVVYQQPDGVMKPNYATSGTSDNWSAEVAELAGHSPVMVFGCCLTLAAALLEPCDYDGGGIHLKGKSSKGKSLTARVARSVCGEAVKKTWSATISGVEAAACAFNNSILWIDEIGELRGTEAQQATLIRQTAFKIESGEGALRGGSYGAVEQRWRLFFISTGEISLAEVSSAAGKKRFAGEDVRCPDLPCTFGPFGVFKTLHPDHKTSAGMAKALRRATKKYYGSPFRDFVAAVADDIPGVKREVDSLVEAFYPYALVSEDGWERRFAEKFALASAAGILATRWKILPWTEDHIRKAAKVCYRRARKAVPDAKTLLKRGLARWRAYIGDPDELVDLRNMSKEERRRLKPKKGKGFLRHNKKHKLHVIVKKSYFRGWLKNRLIASLVLQEFDRTGKLKRDPTGEETRQIQLGPRRKSKRRYLVIQVEMNDVAWARDAK